VDYAKCVEQLPLKQVANLSKKIQQIGKERIKMMRKELQIIKEKFMWDSENKPRAGQTMLTLSLALETLWIAPPRSILHFRTGTALLRRSTFSTMNRKTMNPSSIDRGAPIRAGYRNSPLDLRTHWFPQNLKQPLLWRSTVAVLAT
jgi:hypothetical protein